MCDAWEYRLTLSRSRVGIECENINVRGVIERGIGCDALEYRLCVSENWYECELALRRIPVLVLCVLMVFMLLLYLSSVFRPFFNYRTQYEIAYN